MKKNISINISGIIFHIEEDGYESLKAYLDSINRYFSTFEDSSEILADIESRIAEIFLSKLNAEKQVITSDDVNSLIATMGSVSDFRAAEASSEKEAENANPGSDYGKSSSESSYSYAPPKRLFRDQRRKILGGVCAGLGNYFSIDPLWFRLLFAALLFAGGFTIVVYVLMWIIVPGSYTLDEPPHAKKMFRDPETKIIGGVSGGVAAYFGVDVVLVRFIFVLLLFTGLGIFLYIILWICLPEARTITDKIQMQGEPVTLSNIESSIKRNLNIGEGEEESTATKILLFPFRLIGLLISALGKILDPLSNVLRFIIGIILILMGVGLGFAIIVTGSALLGLLASGTLNMPWLHDFNEMDLPIEVFTRAFPGWVVIAGFVAAFIPCLFLILLGTSAIAKRIVFRGAVGWTLVALFLISAAMLAVGIPQIVYSFHEEGEYRVEQTYQITGKSAVLKLNTGPSDYDAVRLTLRGHQGPDFRLVQTFEAQGSSRGQAVENAKMVEYSMTFQDSVFTFDEDLRFKEKAVFRGQHLNMILYIPYDFPFTMDYNMSHFISQYVDREYADGYMWKMTPDGLKCINCGTGEGESESVSSLSNFRSVEISGKFDLRIKQGDTYEVEFIRGDKSREQYDIRVDGETLVIDYVNDDKVHWEDWEARRFSIDEMDIVVTVPALEKVEANGLGTIRLEDIKTPTLEIETRGPVTVKGNIDANDFRLRLTGKGAAELSGQVGNMNAEVMFASKLRAFDLVAKKAFVEVGGASSAKINVTETLEMDEGVASDIDYRGNPEVLRHD